MNSARVVWLGLGLTAILALSTNPPIAQLRAASDGALSRYDLNTFKRTGELSGPRAEGEFGTQVSHSFLVTAPAAVGGGALAFVTGDEIDQEITADELLDGPAARLGESWGDLGHPPGTTNALVIGAPGEPSADARAPAPAAIIVAYRTLPNAFQREVRRVTGTAGSLFGWRVAVGDSQFPAASYHASFFVTAPLESKGKQAPTGAVYKFDTNTGKQLWRFRGERPGEYAGYSMRPTADQDGDGFTDVYVGAPGTSVGAPAGRVYLLSGRTGKVIRRLEAPGGALHFGYALANSGIIPALGVLQVAAPGTANGKKTAAGAVYTYPDLDGEPQVFRGRKRGQRLGLAIAISEQYLIIGSREGHKKVRKDARGGVTVFSPTGRRVKFLRGKRAGEHFGRAIAVAFGVNELIVGSPGAAPLFEPE